MEMEWSYGDVTKVERMILGQDSDTPAADVNQDGVGKYADVVAIEKIILGRPLMLLGNS